MAIGDVRVLLSGVQAHIEDRIGLNAVVAADLVANPQLERITRIPEKIEEGLQIGARVTHDRERVASQLGIKRERCAFGRFNLTRWHEMKPTFVIIVLTADADQLITVGIVISGYPRS